MNKELSLEEIKSWELLDTDKSLEYNSDDSNLPETIRLYYSKENDQIDICDGYNTNMFVLSKEEFNKFVDQLIEYKKDIN